MTRSTRSMLSIVAVLAGTAALAPVAGAGYYVEGAVGNSAGDEQSSGYSSSNSIVGPSAPVTQAEEAAASANQNRHIRDGSRAEPFVPWVSGQPPAVADDGFDWGDASIGAATAVAIALLMGLALVSTRRRHRTAVQPTA
jgi:hypothetical protein